MKTFGRYLVILLLGLLVTASNVAEAQQRPQAAPAATQVMTVRLLSEHTIYQRKNNEPYFNQVQSKSSIAFEVDGKKVHQADSVEEAADKLRDGEYERAAVQNTADGKIKVEIGMSKFVDPSKGDARITIGYSGEVKFLEGNAADLAAGRKVRLTFTERGIEEVNAQIPKFFTEAFKLAGLAVKSARVITPIHQTFSVEGDTLTVENTTMALEVVMDR